MASSGLTAQSPRPNLQFNWLVQNLMLVREFRLTLFIRVFLIELLVCGVLTLFFLFYFNRLFATLISYGIRAYTWHRYRVWIDIRALQISLLGGRVFFKGFRYHGENETILVHGGYITWRYWLHKVRTVERGSERKTQEHNPDGTGPVRGRNFGGGEKVGLKGPNDLPCRIAVSLQGLEWFVYNRSAAYDYIRANLLSVDDEDQEAKAGVTGITVDPPLRLGDPPGEKPEAYSTSTLRHEISELINRPRQINSYTSDKPTKSFEDSEVPTRGVEATDTAAPVSPLTAGSSEDGDGVVLNERTQMDTILLNVLPIHVECNKGAVVMGNGNTKCILVAKFEGASGEIDAGLARHVDKYKQLFNFHFTRPVVQLKPNPDYAEPQVSRAVQSKKPTQENPSVADRKRQRWFFQIDIQKIWRKAKRLMSSRVSDESTSAGTTRGDSAHSTRPFVFGEPDRWLGLSRYLDDSQQGEQDEWGSIEYATFPTVLDCPSARMSFYWDVPGLVPGPSVIRRTLPPGAAEDINGGIPPEWGIDLAFQGGTIYYGPWTDRQRSHLQNIFFPRLYKNSRPGGMLKPGEPRVSTVFKLFVELEEHIVLRIPTKEGSKDWKWKGRSRTVGGIDPLKQRKEKKPKGKTNDKGGPGPGVRPFGWLDLKVMANSTVSYSMDMVAGSSGYKNKLDLDLQGSELSTSVNHGILWKSERQTISCDLSNPLEWNGLHTWRFEVSSRGLELFLLREHVFLLTDLINDWGSGLPPDYYTFTPFRYISSLGFSNFKIYLNVNDSNIVNNPSDLDDNTFIVLHGPDLSCDLSIPLDKYRPTQNKIPFKIAAHNLCVNLHTPPWNTQATFLDSAKMATAKDGTVSGWYNYYTSTLASNTDTLLMDIQGSTVSIDLYGFLIRYFMKLKENYFGENVRFKTLEEFQDLVAKRQTTLPVPDTQAEHHKKSNDLDVILNVQAEEVDALLPANLYSSKGSVRFHMACSNVDLRFTNYYMDLKLTFSPLAISLSGYDDDEATPGLDSSQTQLFVDGINLYGHRLFGLPPTEPTYVCNWDFDVGSVTGECSTDFFKALVFALRAFIFTFDDDENALPLALLNVLHDVTFLRANVQQMKIWLHVEEAAFLLDVKAIKAQFDDWATTSRSNLLALDIVDLVLACVDGESASRHRSQPLTAVRTHGFLQTTILLTLIQRKLGFSKRRALQQKHIKYHDQRTGRAEFLIHHNPLDDTASGATEQIDIDPPAMPFPPMPEPLLNGRQPSRGNSSHRSGSFTHSASRKNSFLSKDTSSIASGGSVVKRSSSYHSAPESASNLWHHGELSMTRIANPPHKIVLAPMGGQPPPRGVDPLNPVRGGGPPPPSVTFSSAFIAPYFPLLNVQPDLRNVPIFPAPTSNEDSPDQDAYEYCDSPSPEFDEDTVQTSFLVNFKSGIRGYCDPEALRSVVSLLEQLQPKSPVDIIDDLQLDIVSKVMSHAREKLRSSKTIDFNVKLPYSHIRFSSPSSVGNGHTPQHRSDQYDLLITQFAINARSRLLTQGRGTTTGSNQFYSTHMLLESFSLSAKDNPENTNPAIQVQIKDVVFWAVSEEATTANLNAKTIEGEMDSKSLEHIAALIHRTDLLISELTKSSLRLVQAQRKRLQCLIFNLVSAGEGVPDPSFLARPSYVLRSTSDHLRLDDSWKIISRFRHMYRSLPDAIRDEFLLQCLTNSSQCPEDAQRTVISSLDQWRSWELAHVKESYALQRIYGVLEDTLQPSELSGRPVRALLMAGSLKFIIDPGPKQDEAALDGIIVGIGLDVPQTLLIGDTDQTTPTARTTNVQIHCRNVGVHLNWELREMIEDALKLYDNREQRTAPQPPRSLPLESRPASNHHYHLIMNTERGAITLDGINLKAVSSAKDLTLSLVGTENSSGNRINTAFLHADATSSEILSHSRQLLNVALQKPSLYLALDAQATEQGPVHTWKLAANCKDLRFELLEEVVDLIGVVDLILGDEVTQVLHLVKGRQITEGQPIASMAADQKTTHRVSVGLLLDTFGVSFALLHSLEYVCSGTVARTSITKGQNSELVFNFDLREHHHEVRTISNGSSESISVLNMPFVNGRIRQTTGEEKLFQIFVSVESIAFDGAAVHGLLNAFRRPEVANTIGDARAEILAVTKHFESTFGMLDKQQPLETPPTSIPLVYDAHITIAGLGIRESAPEADLNMSFGCIQMNAANRSKQNGPISEFPELHIGLRRTVFELLRSGGDGHQSCGNLAFGAHISLSLKQNSIGNIVPAIHVKSDSLEINLFAETASTIVAVISHLQGRIKKLDFSEEVKVLRTRLRRSNRPQIAISDADLGESISSVKSENAVSLIYSLEMLNIQVSWVVGSSATLAYNREIDDLVLSFKRIDLATRRENATRLMIEDFQLQMVPSSRPGKKTERSLNSALLPEVVFNVAHFSTKQDRRLAFQAKGKSLDLRLTSQFILPASHLERSIATASKKFRAASATWEKSMPTQMGVERSNLFGGKRLASLLVDADFAGAVVYIQGRQIGNPQKPAVSSTQGAKISQHGRYGQFTQGDASTSTTTLRAPGVACKIEYMDNGKDDPSLNAEIKVDASSNVIYPTVVPLVMEISSSVKDIVREDDQNNKPVMAKPSPQKFLDEDKLTADPSAILGRCKLNVGLRICRQEFSLSCQPIARVAATARIEDLYITVNTIKSVDHGHFSSISAAFTGFEASVQHVYSRESTGSFDIESIVLSLMNSKHVSGTSGISAILKISPMRAQINAKQLQDFLLFRDIWVPTEILQSSSAPVSTPSPETPGFSVQRYQQVAAAGAFPWNATIAIAELDVQLDLGQSLGKSAFAISNFWVCSKKTSDWEQSLSLGFGKTAVSSTGRMSGFVELQDFKVRTSIQWPSREMALNQTPLIQASISFEKLRAKTAFEYQAFLIADITSFGFIMYNVRDGPTASGDRLVASLDGDKVQVFFTTNSAAQGYALYQALLRLVQEKKTAYDLSLKEIEKFLRRKSISNPLITRSQEPVEFKPENTAPFSLHTDVMVTLKALNVGTFPGTFFDVQLFKIEASNAEARFAVTMDGDKIHSGLGMTLGQLRISLSGVRRPDQPQSPGEVSVDDVVSSATDSRGGTILQVPKVVATMQTWQTPGSNKIDYIFRSSFEGKVDVGWNYNRVQYIRTMWANHSRALSQRLGKPLSQNTLTITGGPQPELAEGGTSRTHHEQQQEKITAVVNVPQSRYDYTALETPVIEAPQLRDMGEATPPLEWIGLHRDRLPNLTHQIVIVSLLEVARKAEDAYGRILGSS